MGTGEETNELRAKLRAAQGLACLVDKIRIRRMIAQQRGLARQRRMPPPTLGKIMEGFEGNAPIMIHLELSLRKVPDHHGNHACRKGIVASALEVRDVSGRIDRPDALN